MCADDTFLPVPTIDALLLEHAFRRRVFNLLLRHQKITPAIVEAMHSWKHSGFSAHTAVRVLPEEPKTAERLQPDYPIFGPPMVAWHRGDHTRRASVAWRSGGGVASPRLQRGLHQTRQRGAATRAGVMDIAGTPRAAPTLRRPADPNRAGDRA